jgi:hypothetical protein
VQLARSAAHLARISRNAVPVATSELSAETVALLAEGRRPELCVSADVDRPSVAGFFRPRILLPEGLLERVTPLELEQILRHEREHLHRYDDWVNLAQKLALAVFPLNPALLVIERRLAAERERRRRMRCASRRWRRCLWRGGLRCWRWRRGNAAANWRRGWTGFCFRRGARWPGGPRLRREPW